MIFGVKFYEHSKFTFFFPPLVVLKILKSLTDINSRKPLIKIYSHILLLFLIFSKTNKWGQYKIFYFLLGLSCYILCFFYLNFNLWIIV